MTRYWGVTFSMAHPWALTLMENLLVNEPMV